MSRWLFLSILLVISLLAAGCTSTILPSSGKNAAQYAEKINASHTYYDNLVAADPGNATAWVIRGNYYNDAFGQYQVALASYDTALTLDPENGYTWYSKGIALANMNLTAESQAAFANATRYGFTGYG